MSYLVLQRVVIGQIIWRCVGIVHFVFLYCKNIHNNTDFQHKIAENENIQRGRKNNIIIKSVHWETESLKK